MIPKIIHIVWVGDKEQPTQWINTWKEKHPNWEIIIWDNKRVREYEFINRKHIDSYFERGIFRGVADLVRYEAVYNFGGVAIPADSKCVNPIDDLISEPFICYENEAHYGGRLCPLFAAEKGNSFLKKVIDGLYAKEELGEPWIECGNCYLTEVYRDNANNVRVLPSHFFMPNHRLGGNWNGEDKIYAYQFSSSTFANMGSEEPIISIVIPVWGEYEMYLPQCLQSIVEQTFKDYEVIIINTPNLPKARNEGIRKAKGKYILPLDVDDKLDGKYLEKVVSELKDWDVVTTEHQEFESHNSRSYWSDEITLEGILKGDKPIACSAFRKEVWEKLGGYDENFYKGFEDWDFWIRCAKEGFKMKRIKEVLYYYRKHKGGMSEGIHENQERFNQLKVKHLEL